MIIAPHTLSIITTHRCTAACDHCCFGCTPSKEHRLIPAAHLHEYIEQAAEVPSFRVVVFTGGECFMLGKDLDELVGKANQNGLRPRFVSNGYWATSLRQARQRIDRLVKNGLREANFSTGDMHARYVKPEYVKNGAIASAEAGLDTVIMVELFRGSEFDFDMFVEDADLTPYLEDGKITLKLSPWMPFDGTEDLDYTDAYLDEIETAASTAGCQTLLRVLAINPAEELIACCGLTLEEIEEVHLGSLRERTIKEIIDQTPDDFVKIWVHLHGPDAVIRYAQSLEPKIERPRELAHICDACRYMYHHPQIKKVIKENPPPNKDEIVQEYFRSLFLAPNEGDIELSSRIHTTQCSLSKMRELRRIAI